MTPEVRVKICGLTRPEDVSAAAEAGAAYAGFVFFPKSPRNVTIETARDLAVDVPVGVAKVALVVNADDALLDAITGAVPIDIVQLHGAETPERVAEIRARTGLPVMKAVGVADAEDVAALDLYEEVADQILVDAKPPKNAELPGGNGVAFDWRLISARRWSKPWMLAGGLIPDNVAEAIALTGAKQVDVSSGVEASPGIKDAGLVRDFIEATRVPVRL
ncbi:phosphoribosylanthranilate isomerase [Marivita sp. XM-24bin2]|jgi:phosphoribosylanthranilate isomerase|uniref:phosphoribosylanthranilate isomerase n=1 Tax=unclassified Marivita TaxID=2632480 RepID=UPI000D794CA7|nr:phosphoribosylanthranilate isomerase [Marivita sp. XM-24bin2]MCR9111134.1 phosphoribosylanthranilate isomerase [Paracoccaceae bacterium]PWL36461.1 MAG: phosphoribosylanthranilate isomerase [Marivita sp. XM-24bin2]